MWDVAFEEAERIGNAKVSDGRNGTPLAADDAGQALTGSARTCERFDRSDP